MFNSTIDGDSQYVRTFCKAIWSHGNELVNEKTMEEAGQLMIQNPRAQATSQYEAFQTNQTIVLPRHQ
jgi:hypothetical protein